MTKKWLDNFKLMFLEEYFLNNYEQSSFIFIKYQVKIKNSIEEINNTLQRFKKRKIKSLKNFIQLKKLKAKAKYSIKNRKILS